jgi:hypothetical protein
MISVTTAAALAGIGASPGPELAVDALSARASYQSAEPDSASAKYGKRYAMATGRKNESASDAGGSRKAIRVPGGWKLPGDDTVYPYDPLVPPDAVRPVPRPPKKKPEAEK